MSRILHLLFTTPVVARRARRRRLHLRSRASVGPSLHRPTENPTSLTTHVRPTDLLDRPTDLLDRPTSVRPSRYFHPSPRARPRYFRIRRVDVDACDESSLVITRHSSPPPFPRPRQSPQSRSTRSTRWAKRSIERGVAIDFFFFFAKKSIDRSIDRSRMTAIDRFFRDPPLPRPHFGTPTSSSSSRAIDGRVSSSVDRSSSFASSLVVKKRTRAKRRRRRRR